MASVVKRPRGWEIRETIGTDRGPRSRTLATFKRLDQATIHHACARASKSLEPTELIDVALRAGAPVEAPAADTHAVALIRALQSGDAPRPSLRRLLADQLGEQPAPSSGIRATTEWLGRSTVERGAALVDLLLLADAIPAQPRSGPLAFPPFGTREP